MANWSVWVQNFEPHLLIKNYFKNNKFMRFYTQKLRIVNLEAQITGSKSNSKK